jgi:hypothetical protein
MRNTANVLDDEISLLHLADPKKNDSENLFEIFHILIENGADINCKTERMFCIIYYVNILKKKI